MRHLTTPFQVALGDRVTQRVNSFEPAAVRLHGGPLSERQQTHLLYLKMIEPERLLVPYREQADLEPSAQRYGGWESRDIGGHSLGHYLSALAYMAATTGDTELAARIPRIVDALEECQRANGDGYVLPVDKTAFERMQAGQVEASAFSLNGVWVPFYTLHKLMAGLRDAYRLARCEAALRVACGLADWLTEVLAPLNPRQVQDMLRTEHGGMNEVLADLASDTGEGRYLEMASCYFHHHETIDPMLRGQDRLDGLHSNTQIPKVIGLAREYELTGESTYHLAVESFWEHVVKRRSYANGGHGESEHFFPSDQFPKHLTPNTCETCNSYNMLKLTGHLFGWEPRAAYMDYVERVILNHLAANIGREPGELGYYLGLGSVGVKVFSTPFDSWWCCVGTGMESPGRYAEHSFNHAPGELWINQYFGAELDWSECGAHVRLETEFPEEETVRIRISLEDSQRFKLHLRHPFWCVIPRIQLNGEPVRVDSRPSSYFTIEREWCDGDELTVCLPMRLRMEALPHSDGKTVALMVGPVLLAGIVPEQPGVHNPSRMRYTEHLNARGKTDAMPPVLVADTTVSALSGLHVSGEAPLEFVSEGVVKPRDLRFVPLYRVYEEQYAVYFSFLRQEEWATRQHGLRVEYESRLRLEAATVDHLAPGYQQSEAEHKLAGVGSETAEFSHRRGRLAREGGWFSYRMRVAPGQPMALVLTYWGGVWHERVFEIRIDDKALVVDRLLGDRPGDFFERTHMIPPSWTQGREYIEVRFQSRPGSVVGAVFGVRTMYADVVASLENRGEKLCERNRVTD